MLKVFIGHRIHVTTQILVMFSSLRYINFATNHDKYRENGMLVVIKIHKKNAIIAAILI